MHSNEELQLLETVWNISPMADFFQKYVGNLPDWKVFSYGAHSKILNECVLFYHRQRQATQAAAETVLWDQIPVRPQIQETFPLELWQEIFWCMDLPALGRLAATCRQLYKVVHKLIDRVVRNAFERACIDFDVWRYLLVQTSAVMSGWSAYDLLVLGQLRDSFASSKQIAVYIQNGFSRHFVDYMSYAMGWKLVGLEPAQHEYELERILLHPPSGSASPITIVLHVGRANELEEPRCTALRVGLTSEMVFFDGARLTVPYYSYATSRIAFPNRSYLPRTLPPASEPLPEEVTARLHGVRIRPFARAAARVYNFCSLADEETDHFVFAAKAWGRVIEPKLPVVWRLSQPSSYRDLSRFFVRTGLPSDEQWEESVLLIDAKWEARLVDAA
uniref:F-box domain-containing protein n=1 Tax=Mycena chlorophos TaxID=658473 RepID=A0ABQ0L6K3_MYCCL|nr:predicted protein [Mycena chlorophos]